MTPPDPYADLKRYLADGEVTAFVGAGMSAGASLPGWYDLIAELTARIGYELPPPKWATGDALIEAAQAYVNSQGLHGLISFLKDRLDTTGKSPSAAHYALARLPIALVFTANFDDLLERAYRDTGKRVEVVTRDASIPFMRRGPGTVNIVKLYGDLDQPDTLVLAREQYDAFFLQRPQMVKLLETSVATSDMLYLGWSHGDPYFKMIFGELLGRFGALMRPGYAAMFDVTEAQRVELTRRHIRVVELPGADRTASLAAWLAILPAAGAPQAVQPSPRPAAGSAGAVPASAGAPLAPTAAQLPGGARVAAGGERSIAIGGNVSGSVIIIGNGNVVGDGSSSNVVKGQPPVRPDRPSETCQVSSSWNAAAIRDLLNAAFNDEELTTLCFDTFRPVYEDFATGMSKGQKVQRLLDYCIRQEQVDDLLAAVQRANPRKYEQYERKLKG
ncbi:MAG: SIR2 family protein [Chloroflexi bacterium]|nr:SIR2 family protein [Chloroflexota bacterium]